MKIFILSVSYDFKSLMGPRKSRCDVPNGTTYKWVCHEGHIIYLVEKNNMDKKLGQKICSEWERACH